MSRLRLAPIGLSVLINLALIGLMARVLVSAPAQEQRYIAVELRAPSTFNVQRSTFNAQLPKPAVQRSSTPVQRPSQPVRRSPSPIDHRPLTTDHSPSLQTPGAIEVAGSRESFTSSEGGTSATGPGAFVGEGSGGGITGSREGRTVASPAPAPNTEHPTPGPPPTTYNPQPTTPTAPPRGESRAPSVAKQMKPIYPQDARDDGIEGTAVILALISPGGKVTDTRLETSSGDRRLDQAALDAVGKWTYNPCLKDGAPVKSSVRIRVEFRLE